MGNHGQQTYDDKFQYSLKFQVLTDMSVMHLLIQHKITNKITLSAVCTVHDLTLPGRLSIKLEAQILLAAFEDFAHCNSIIHRNSFSNFCEVYS